MEIITFDSNNVGIDLLAIFLSFFKCKQVIDLDILNFIYSY